MIEDIIFALVCLVFALLFWFKADVIGSFTGYAGKGRWIDKPTPGCMVKPVGIFFFFMFLRIMWEIFTSFTSGKN